MTKKRLKKKFLYATIKRGKVKVTSKKQLQLLNARGLPYTAVYRRSDGKIIKIRKNVK